MHSVSVNRLLQCLMAKRWQALTLLLFLGMQTAYAQDSMIFTKVIRCESQNPERTKGQDCFNPPADLGLGDIVLAQGKIERKSEDGFGEAVKNLPAGTIVVLNSMGGDLDHRLPIERKAEA